MLHQNCLSVFYNQTKLIMIGSFIDQKETEACFHVTFGSDVNAGL